MSSSLFLAIVAAITGALAMYYGYRRYVVAKIEKARIAIAALVKKIHNNPIAILHAEYRKDKRGGVSGGGNTRTFNLFEFGTLNSLEDAHSDWDTHPVVFAKGINYMFDIDEHISDPNLPREIADELEKFKSYRFQQINYKQLDSGYIPFTVIKMGYFKETTFNQKEKDSDLKKPENIAFESWKSFKACCENLTAQIENWAKAKGISFNLRKDYNNPY